MCGCVHVDIIYYWKPTTSISSPLIVKRLLCLYECALFEQYAVGCLVVSSVAFRSFCSLQVQIQRRGAKEGELLCGMPVLMDK